MTAAGLAGIVRVTSRARIPLGVAGVAVHFTRVYFQEVWKGFLVAFWSRRYSTR